MNRKPSVSLTDTTLRDGQQRPGLCFPPETKLRLLRALDAGGVAIADAGIPAAGSHVKDVMRRMMAERKRIRVSAWNRMRESDIRDAMEVEPDIIHISVPASDRLITRVLSKSHAWVEASLVRCIGLAREHGYTLTVGLQHSTRADIPFMLRLAAISKAQGADMLKLADTVGTLTPWQARTLIRSMAQGGLPLGIHTHNDLGMAVPVAIEAVRAGAAHVDVTCFGIGERAGNCDLFSFVECGSPVLSVTPALWQAEDLNKNAADILFSAIGIHSGTQTEGANRGQAQPSFP
ncbi:MAG TPA: homocitrate synthase [Candidatus Limiplasma sp.]|nr:homocitrate synthase [Candidatus Limiplasma sp.]